MKAAKKLRFALFGCGFWARFQLQAWKELEGAECVAVYNRTRSKAEQFARDLGVPAVYDDAAELLQREKPDFADIVTNPATFTRFVELAAGQGIPVICQKPLAPSVAVAEKMIQSCQKAGVPFFVHENWRWQTPIRELKRILASGEIGPLFRARIRMVSGYPVFKNEPTLGELENFILTDMGTHILDVARFLFGEAQSLYCQVHRVHPDIKGEDVATVMMLMGGQTTVVCELGYPENYLEHDVFPQTLIFAEGAKGSAELGQDYWVRVTTSAGTHARRFPPRHYAWADPDYLVVHSSIVPCNANLLQALRGEGRAETTAEDNLNTIILTFAAYESARTGKAVQL
ncbi:MAG: Gfo/Idh/MocA family oxidoreductase [Verrucomicrobiota bacterium]|jgi:predicted dehydrogenase